MRRKVSAIVAVVAASLLGLAVAPLPARACAPATPIGEWVRIAGETAVIVWDAKAKREHFVRKASFQSSAKDFGFLVPTPTKPELAEIDDGIFDALAWATRPRVETKTEHGGIEVGSLFFATRGATAVVSSVAPVRVLDEVTVGGYDAVVIEADDPNAMATWLADHGYDARPALADWLAPYVARKWKITAFKVASPDGARPGSSAGTLATRAVRMSFDTDKPFFPYREPADQREPVRPRPGAPRDPSAALSPDAAASRDLLVYVVAAQRLSPSIGESGTFPGSVPFAKRLGGELPKAVGDLLDEKSPFVTVLVDPSSPRPGTDELYLVPSGDQGEVEPPPVVQIVRRPFFIPIEGALLIGGFGAFCFYVVRRTRRAPA